MAILKLWTSDAERLTQGQPALADTEPELAQRPARLTVTVGLDPRWCGGDLLLQICADDPSVVAHTSRVLLKNVRAMTVQRWRQNGFRTARAADTSGATMRNLMGQIDGTANPREDADFDRHIWDNGTQQRWFAGGTVLVMRRICTELDTWDELDRASKELTVGRRLDTGAPLTGQREFDEPDLVASEGGIAVIPPNAHIALARHRIRNVVVGTAARAAEPLPILGNLAFGDRRDLGLLDCGPRSGELYFFKVAVRCQQRESGADWAEEKERHKAEDGTVASLGGGSCQFRGGLQNNN